MPFFELLHFGSGTQAIHYFFFCLVAILGTIQGAANYYLRRELLWFEGRPGYLFAALLIAGGFLWFFVVDQEIFTPGLAGGELFTVFAAAFVVAVPATRALALIGNRIRSLSSIPRPEQEKEPLV